MRPLYIAGKKISIEKDPTNTKTPWWMTVIAVVLALVFCAGFMLLNDNNPITVFSKMFSGAFGSLYGLSETLLKAIPLMLCGLGVAIAYRISVWNIGAEGQFVMGAIAATSITIYYPEMGAFSSITLMLLAGFTAGALWALVVAICRSYFDVNEVICSLMLNYIAILFLSFLVFEPWKDPNGFNFPGTAIFNSSQQLPALDDLRLHVGLLIALASILLYAVLVKFTQWGYQLRLLSANVNAARYAGMHVKRQIIIVLMISGGLAGIAGMVEVSGVTHRLSQGVSSGYGYTAIIVAWLARLNPIGIVISSILCGAVIVGGYSVQLIGLPASMALMIQGAILFFVIGGEVFSQYRIRLAPTKLKNTDQKSSAKVEVL